MKTLQLLPSLEVGGVERGVVDLAKSLGTRGHQTVVISSGGSLVQELVRMGVKHYELPVNKKSLFSLKLVPVIAQIIEREQIDLVHARSRVPAWIGWLAARKAGVPFVTTCHGYYSTHFLSRIMGWGKRVIVISRTVGRHMIDDFKVPAERIRLVHRGLDLAQFRFVPGRYAEKRPTLKILNVGRLSPIKGHLEFLKAVHLLKRKLSSIEVLIVGSEGKGKTKYTGQIQETIRQLGLESTVRLLGTRRDIPELLASADLLVMSTLVPEAFGRVLIEAGAVGTAVLATRVGGVMDVIDHGENGRLVTPGDVQAMAGEMHLLLTDRAQTQRYARQLHEKVCSQFTLEQMTAETLRVYEEVLREKKILVMKLGAAGDLILATPSFRMLRKRFPHASMALLVDKNLSGLAASGGHFDEIIAVDRKKLNQPGYLLKLAKRLRREGYDISIDLQNTKWTHLLAAISLVRERYGFARGRFAFLLNRPDHGYAAVEAPVRHQFRIISKLGVTEFDDALELVPTESAQAKAAELLGPRQGSQKWIGLVTGASPAWATKRWPLEYFEALARLLMDRRDCRIVLLGTAEDAARTRGFLKGSEAAVTNLCGKTSLEELVAVIRQLDLVVTGDSAPLHIAAALKKKIVCFFGPTDPKRHMPPAADAALLMRRLECQPCYQGKCRNAEELACLRRITVDEAYESVLKQLRLGVKNPAMPKETAGSAGRT